MASIEDLERRLRVLEDTVAQMKRVIDDPTRMAPSVRPSTYPRPLVHIEPSPRVWPGVVMPSLPGGTPL